MLSAFLGGLMGGVHCIGMCGGIVSALSLGIDGQLSQPAQRWKIMAGYHLGRISSYTLAGMLMGGLGLLSADLSGQHQIRQILQLIAAGFMILLGLYLGGWLMWLTRIERIGGLLWRRIEPIGRRLMPVRSLPQAVLLGLIWGWLPCGLVYTALVWAISAGGSLQGGLLMLSFGLGTLPVMLATGAAAGGLAGFLRRRMVRTLAGLLVAGFGVVLLVRATAA